VLRKSINFIKNCLSSSWRFSEDGYAIQSRFQMLNIVLFLSIFALLRGVWENYERGMELLEYLELLLALLNFASIILLQLHKKYFHYVTTFLNIEFISLVFLLMLKNPPSDLKHIWLFAFPIITFFFEGSKRGKYWVGAIILSLFAVKLQPFTPIAYTYNQIFYLAFVLLLTSITVYFYQYKVDKDSQTILEQRDELLSFNEVLEKTVKEKTQKLQELNRKLEKKVEKKVAQITQKDALLLNQSRQAAMGEMLSMIAHQWRQPLSTITLQIANLKFNMMLSKSSEEDVENALDQISNTASYLADTINDFQSYFKPNKKSEVIKISLLIEHALNFVKPRVDMYNVMLQNCIEKDAQITININEITQVLINLINNAIDQLNAKNIKEKKICINVSFHNDIFFIDIIDNGGGIDPEIIDNVFDPYFSTKGKNGTGIGLYMAKMIIEQHFHGNISVQNASEGAQFTLTLPQDSTKEDA